MADIAGRVARDLGVPDLVELLSGLPPSELNSLLLEVERRQSARRSPAQVLEAFGRSRLFGVGVAMAELHAIRGAMLAACEAFELREVSPLTPLGTTSTVAPISPDWSVAALHGAETVSDPTNVLALEAARRRRAGIEGDMHLGTLQRVVRPQRFADPKLVAHFALLALVSAGRDRGSLNFERAALATNVEAHLQLIRSCLGQAAPVRLTYSAATGFEPLVEVMRNLADRHGAGFEAEPGRDVSAYYKGFCFHIFGNGSQLSDGGLTDWTGKLLSNGKERLLISGMGVEWLRLPDCAAVKGEGATSSP